MSFYRDILKIDARKEIDRISQFIIEVVRSERKDGVVVGLSGGIDSAVISALCVRALGLEKVYGLILPEKDSNPESAEYAIKHSKEMGLDHEIIDISSSVESFGAYEIRDGIIKKLYPEYNPSFDRIKISLPNDILENDGLNFFSLSITRGKEIVFDKRLKKWDMKGIIAATDIKQRTRMVHLYHKAESMNRLVCGTTNRPETMQGFFVRYGDGGVDLEPIAHLYKSQVYQLAEELGIISEIINRPPSPDTFNSFVNDEEFFFRMPYEMVDLLLYAWENGIDRRTVCEVLSLDDNQVIRTFRDINSKFEATRYLRELPPSLLNGQ